MNWIQREGRCRLRPRGSKVGQKIMTARTKWLVAVLGFVGLMSSWTTPAVAQAQGRPRRKVIRIQETRIEGRIQKPQAFYILQRSNLNFEGLDLKQSFTPRIIQSVRRPTF
jgi:hypothetical protein